jgi:23S rRNA G2445 N2-methylase RlmL
VVASIEGRRRYNRYEVQDAVGAALAPVLRGRYLTRTGTAGPAAEPELTVRVFVRGPSAVAALRLAARPLHRRGYKADTGAGTLHPPLAAAMVRLADPPPGGVLLDPFAGDGTIAVESALAYPRTRAVAADLDPRRLANAARNAARAGAAAALVRADAAAPPWRPGRVTTVVTNPPWNLAVDARGALVGSLERFWRQLPDLLAAAGRACLLTDAELAAPAALERAGFQLALATRLRLAGRISHLILCAPAGQPRPGLPGDLGSWRRRARSCGVVTDDGF